jgi:toxin ParE1/3/4
MMNKLQFTPPARVQFISIFEYINLGNPAAAKKFRNRVLKTFENIKTFPEMGRVAPEFPELGFREVIVKPYRFLYDIVGDTIWIVGAWHSAQLPEEPKTVD